MHEDTAQPNSDAEAGSGNSSWNAFAVYQAASAAEEPRPGQKEQPQPADLVESSRAVEPPCRPETLVPILEPPPQDQNQSQGPTSGPEPAPLFAPATTITGQAAAAGGLAERALQQTREWAERIGLRYEFHPRDGELVVGIPGSERAEVELSTFDAPPDSRCALLVLADRKSGWEMILNVPHNGRIERLHALLDAAPKPIELARFREIRAAVLAEFPGTVDEVEPFPTEA